MLPEVLFPGFDLDFSNDWWYWASLHGFGLVAKSCPTLWTWQLSIINSWSLLKLMSIELVTPSNYLILCHSLLLPPSIFPSIRVFSSESVLHIRWLKYWSFSFSIRTSNKYSGLISFRIDCLSDLIPWIYLSLPLYNCKGFDLGHTWMV